MVKEYSHSLLTQNSLNGSLHLPQLVIKKADPDNKQYHYELEMESDCTKIDPAMLASTVTLPKIELGLLYAYGITEVMCRGWTRTILHTLASIAGMNKTQIGNMSIEAFCLLTGIPDVGLRMQTLRITEFFLLINSQNCISGKTTLARLCALTHQSSTQIEQVLQDLFHKDTKINHRKKNRLADTVKWMKKFELQIIDKGEDKSDMIEKINNLSQVLNTIPTQISTFSLTQMDQLRQENENLRTLGMVFKSLQIHTFLSVAVEEQCALTETILSLKWQPQQWLSRHSLEIGHLRCTLTPWQPFKH